MSMISTGNKKGALVAEILIVVAIIAIVLTSFLSVSFLSLKLSSSTKEKIEANMLAEDLAEGVRNFRDGTDWAVNGLGSLSSGAYHLDKSLDVLPEWLMVSGEETVGMFTRGVVFEDVSRDPVTGEIEDIYNSFNDDLDTKKVVITVSWEGRKIEIINYLTNWQ